MIYVPVGSLRTEQDEEAEHRRMLAEALRRGEQISVAPSGVVMTQADKQADPDAVTITVPDGKLA